jgi:hypothetical protein
MRLETTLEPRALLAELQKIERQMGRQRGDRWDARVIDLDLLLYDDRVEEDPQLQLPHPRMAFRRFVLEPAAEVGGQMVHPLIGWSIEMLLQHARNAIAYVAIAGPVGVGKTHLGRSASALVGGRMIAQGTEKRRPLPGARDVSPGQARRVELEFLHRRAAMLAESRWPSRDVPAVSDFWFDQSLEYAALWLSRPVRDEIQQRWDELRASVVPPKLLVLLDAPVEWVVAQQTVPVGQQLSAAQLERLRQGLTRRSRQTHVGPVLRCDARNAELCLEEVVAAVQAMN